MKKCLSRRSLVMMLFWTTLSSNYACSALPLAPPLKERTLKINPEEPGFVYRWQECIRKFVFCLKYEWREEKYDMNDPAIRQQLFDMGFELEVRE